MNERRDIGFGSPMKMIAQKRQCFVDNMCFSYIKMKSQNNTPSEQCLNYTRKSSKRSQHGDFITLTYTGVMGSSGFQKNTFYLSQFTEINSADHTSRKI